MEMAGIAELLDEDFADLEQYCDQFESHRCYCFFLLFRAQQVIQLGNEMVVDDGCDFVGGGAENGAIEDVLL